MPAANSVEPDWKICALPCGCWRPAIPGGMVQLAPPSLVIIALAPFCAIANQVRRVVAALPVSMKYGYQETPPDGNPVAADRLPAVAPVGGFDDAVGLVKPADQVGGVVGIDRERVQADIERGLDERRPAVDGLEDGVVARRPDRGGRRPRHRDHVAARDVGERVVDQRPGVAVVRRLPEPRAAAADIDVARPRRIAGDAAGAVHVRGRAENGGHAGRRDVDPDTPAGRSPPRCRDREAAGRRPDPRHPDRRSWCHRRRSAGTVPGLPHRRGAGVSSIHRNVIREQYWPAVRRMRAFAKQNTPSAGQ